MGHILNRSACDAAKGPTRWAHAALMLPDAPMRSGRGHSGPPSTPSHRRLTAYASGPSRAAPGTRRSDRHDSEQVKGLVGRHLQLRLPGPPHPLHGAGSEADEPTLIQRRVARKQHRQAPPCYAAAKRPRAEHTERVGERMRQSGGTGFTLFSAIQEVCSKNPSRRGCRSTGRRTGSPRVTSLPVRVLVPSPGAQGAYRRPRTRYTTTGSVRPRRVRSPHSSAVTNEDTAW